jgi:hypothetical protein
MHKGELQLKAFTKESIISFLETLLAVSSGTSKFKCCFTMEFRMIAIKTKHLS